MKIKKALLYILSFFGVIILRIIQWVKVGDDNE